MRPCHCARDAAKAQLEGRKFFFSPKGGKEEGTASRTAAAKEAAVLLLSNPKASIEKIKSGICIAHKIAPLKNSEILCHISDVPANSVLRARLQKSPTRTLSGVSPLALMPPPFPCVGRCIYCPRGENAPQSYTGFEPTTMRAIECGYEAKRQVECRLRQYAEQGHNVDKCHLIFMGGTLLAAPPAPRRRFVKEAFDALNGFPSPNLGSAMNANENAPHRAIGVTYETRPDFAMEKEADEMLFLGGTQVELGVQALSDRVYSLVQRGHTLLEVERATHVLKDSGFKVCYHMMPGLYSTPKQDARHFQRLFSTSRFQPDMLKIYPCLVLSGAQIHREWKRGRYSPYSTEEAAMAIALATKHIPSYVRVSRIQRDIPSPLVVAGVKHSNLRQIVDAKLASQGTPCRCIRCREIGSAERRGAPKSPEKLSLSLLRTDYFASCGKEIFLSFEDERQDLLAGFIRLRIPGKSHRLEISGGECVRGQTSSHAASSIVRELHVYGSEAAISERSEGKLQHKGIGKKLLLEAERITKHEFGLGRISVLSGAGARGYYRKFGYSLNGPYMQKKL